MRRLPIYLLLDTSGSMNGEPIEAVKNGVQMLIAALRQDPYALETAYISIITFDSKAKQIVPLTELALFQMPSLVASGTTVLGEGLSLLADKIDTEVVKTTLDKKGDWKPMVFIMTDGAPTDDWRQGLDKLKKQKLALTVACAAGSGAKPEMLKNITELVVVLETTDASGIASFFKWVSASISTSSEKIETSGQGDVNSIDDLPPPPPEIIIYV